MLSSAAAAASSSAFVAAAAAAAVQVRKMFEQLTSGYRIRTIAYVQAKT